MTKPTVSKGALAWFVRGSLVSLLLMAALNALSYFVRTGGWGSLLGGLPQSNEAIGFPLTVWREGNGYLDLASVYLPMGINVLVALAGSIVCGLLTLTQMGWLNRMVVDLEAQQKERKEQRLQFSLRGLLLATFLAALCAAIARQWAARPEVLGAIYVLGPALLIAVVMLPRGLSLQQRVGILTPATLILIAVAVAVGTALEMQFDRVVLGIFVCWVPQTVLAALALTCGILVVYFRRLHGSARFESGGRDGPPES